MNMGEATLNLSIRGQDISREGSSQKSVVVDCNFHYEEQFDTTLLLDKINGWGAKKDMIASALDKVLCD